MFALEDGDTGEAILPSLNGSAPAEADKVNDRSAYKPDDRVKLLVGLSRWERAGMLAWIAASQPDVFDDAVKALGYR